MDQAALQPFVQMQMMMGWVDGTAVLAAAELGLADHLASGPRTTDELARRYGRRSNGPDPVPESPDHHRDSDARRPGSVRAGTDGPVPPHQRPGSQRLSCRMMGRMMAPAFLRGDISVSTGRPSFETVGR
jgi:hypothetical protein